MRTIHRYYWCGSCRRYFLRRSGKAWIRSMCDRTGRYVRLTLRKERPRVLRSIVARLEVIEP